MSTGKYHAAIMSNYQSWEQLVLLAGIESGDLTFPIPFCPELHFSEFTSAVADMKNSCAVSVVRPTSEVRVEKINVRIYTGSNKCVSFMCWLVHRIASRIRYKDSLDSRRYRRRGIFCE